MLAKLSSVTSETEIELESDVSTVEPMYIEDLFESDRIASLLRFMDAPFTQTYCTFWKDYFFACWLCSGHMLFQWFNLTCAR